MLPCLAQPGPTPPRLAWGAELTRNAGRQQKAQLGDGVPKSRSLVSRFRERSAVDASQSARDTRGSANKGRHVGEGVNDGTHVGILSIDAGSRDDTDLLLVLVKAQGISVDGSLDDAKASLVSDTVAVSKSRGAAGRVGAGHFMEEGERCRE